MSWTPQRIGAADVALLFAHYPFRRNISAIHLHQSGQPSHHFRGAESIAMLRQQHIARYGLQTLAQHLTIAPDGTLWLGRDWNAPPASVAGHNGNRRDGPLMITLIGNFDGGEDALSTNQRESLLQLLTLIAQRFNLPAETVRAAAELRGHNPARLGWEIEELRQEVERRSKGMRESRESKETREVKESKETKESKGGKEGKESKGGERSPFPLATFSIGRIIETMRQLDLVQEEPLDAEIPEESEMKTISPNGRVNGRLNGQWLANGYGELGYGQEEQARWLGGPRLSEDEIDQLRPHLINLTQGQFSDDGTMRSSKEDVDTLFEEHLPRALVAARARGQKLKVLFYAHGGLVDEDAALHQAAQHIPWWKRNGIYPIYFVWETGFCETLSQLLRREERGARERPTDALIEWLARRLGGPRIWLGMKESAALASAPAQGNLPMGGARYAAQRLKEFCDAHPGQTELYAIGHSAGAIFHNEFVPTALELGVPAFSSVHLLAPAVTVENFKRGMMPKMGNGIQHLGIFTLRKDLELRDDSSPLYNKSILYLIHEALEPSRQTPLLGLEVSLRSDLDLKQAFGLGNRPPAAGVSAAGEIVWAATELESGHNASRARRHGDFGHDAVTLNSLVRRVLDVSDEAEIEEFPDLPAGRSLTWGQSWELPAPIAAMGHGQSTHAAPLGGYRAHATPLGGYHARGQGGRRALCVGIDTYRDAPLYGCVADATRWATTLTRLGFEAQMLTNEQATFIGIQNALRDLLRNSQAGDVVVFQFAGHGTLVDDMNHDEVGGMTPESDQAICPYDHDQGTYLIDDDLGSILAQTPDGVNVTCFMDCCYSGTITRFAVGASAAMGTRGGDQRVRYLKPTAAMLEAHRRFRQGSGRRNLVGQRGPATMREIVFSACQPNEVAWESNGQGDFTRQATRLLEVGGLEIANELFMQQVITAFGTAPRQRPMLDCSDTYRAWPLLQPLTAVPVGETFQGNMHSNANNNGNGTVHGRVPPGVEDAVDQMAAAVQRLQSALQQW